LSFLNKNNSQNINLFNILAKSAAVFLFVFAKKRTNCYLLSQLCLERGADLHVAQVMPLSLTVSCFSKIQIGFTFLVPAHLGSPGKRTVKRVCVCFSTKNEKLTLMVSLQIPFLVPYFDSSD